MPCKMLRRPRALAACRVPIVETRRLRDHPAAGTESTVTGMIRGRDMNLSKRSVLKHSAALVAAVSLLGRRIATAAAEEPPDIPPWMKSPGAGFNEYGVPSKYEKPVTRTLIRSQPGTTGSGAARTPLEALEGTITPSGLHFERSHSGVPEIDPARHRLLIHGMVQRPLTFTIDALLRYPMISRVHFIE